MKTTSVLICGLPSSGNKVIRYMFAAARIRDRGHYSTVISHGEDDDGQLGQYVEKLTETAGRKPVVIVPVRNALAWRRSVEVRWPQGFRGLNVLGGWDEYRRATRRNIARAVARYDLDVLDVSYEGLVENPREVGGDVCDFAGWDPPPDEWFEGVYDGNRHRLDSTPTGREADLLAAFTRYAFDSPRIACWGCGMKVGKNQHGSYEVHRRGCDVARVLAEYGIK